MSRRNVIHLCRGVDADAGRQVDAVDGDGFRFQDEMERPLAVDGDGWTDGRMDGWMHGWMATTGMQPSALTPSCRGIITVSVDGQVLSWNIHELHGSSFINLPRHRVFVHAFVTVARRWILRNL